MSANSDAEAVVQSLQTLDAENRAFALSSVQGEGPGQDAAKWRALFAACYPAAKAPARVPS